MVLAPTDIAPPINGGFLDPHIFGRTYRTRVRAYDNTAGTSMVLTVAEQWPVTIQETQWYSVCGLVKRVEKEVVIIGLMNG